MPDTPLAPKLRAAAERFMDSMSDSVPLSLQVRAAPAIGRCEGVRTRVVTGVARQLLGRSVADRKRLQAVPLGDSRLPPTVLLPVRRPEYVRVIPPAGRFKAVGAPSLHSRSEFLQGHVRPLARAERDQVSARRNLAGWSSVAGFRGLHHREFRERPAVIFRSGTTAAAGPTRPAPAPLLPFGKDETW